MLYPQMARELLGITYKMKDKAKARNGLSVGMLGSQHYGDIGRRIIGSSRSA